jgi:hypothetical protein
MRDVPSPGKLPEQYRSRPSGMPRCLGEIIPDTECFISETGISIDSTWGVWLNPKAAVSSSQNRDTPVKICRTQRGYTVELNYAQKELKKFWVASTSDSFADQEFIPAQAII